MMRTTTLLAFSLLLVTGPAAAQQAAPAATSIAARTTGYEKRDGLLPLYLDEKSGRILLEIPRDSTRVLHFLTLATGLGSNVVGLDRGLDGPNNVALFARVGDRVLVIFENWNFRSSLTTNANHQRSVREAFAASTVASLTVLAEEEGRLLMDATDFFMRDWMDIAATLQQTEQGSYGLVRDRSYIARSFTKGFPENTEVDAALTFQANGRPGPIVSRIAPDGRAITLRTHHSFVRVPDEAFRPRVEDPRTGFFGITFKDYGKPIQEWLETRWISRHRLERVNPSDPTSPFKKKIVYYIDNGMPEPIRTASVQGARIWETVFAEAGLAGAFEVRLLPDGVDPMDARYNVVQWENRTDRGWSVGGSLGDPRTGEILKAMARMDSHRARTDYNLYAGLLGADAAAADTAFVLARIRQVTAHEIGHTLGMAHSYAASTYGRASVMDYPPPRVRLDAAGKIDISAAYAPAGGPFDAWAVRWGYGIFPAATEADSLKAIVADGLKKGYLFLTDQDARPDFGADPRAVLWDDAATPEEFLTHQMDVRRVALQAFGARNIRAGEPLAMLEERFVPVYLMHRFAAGAVAKVVGGVEYTNAVRGDGLQATRVIAAQRQRAALARLTALLAPSALAIPDTVLTLLAPHPSGYGTGSELLLSRTRPMFDELGAARTLAQVIVDAVLQRDRAARLVQQTMHDGSALTFGEVVDAVVKATWGAAPASPRDAALVRVTQRAVVDQLLRLAADREASPDVRGIAEWKLSSLRAMARTTAGRSDEARAHAALVASDITRWIERRELPMPTPALRAPPGDPIGDEPR